MYICPVCNLEFKTEQSIQKHFLACWKEEHPFHKSKDAPRSKNITTREVNEDITQFFNSFKE